MFWPIATRFSVKTALAVAIEQTDSTRLAITPPWRMPIGWRSSSRMDIRATALSGSLETHSVAISWSNGDGGKAGSVTPRG